MLSKRKKKTKMNEIKSTSTQKFPTWILVIILVLLILSGAFFYKSIGKENKNTQSSFGYKFY
jgi:cytochrome b subunit of formate dehydrogenase